MELIQSLLIKALQEEKIRIMLDANIEKIANNTCFMALHRIKAILENDMLSDYACIEYIIQIFDEIGCGVDGRHCL